MSELTPSPMIQQAKDAYEANRFQEAAELYAKVASDCQAAGDILQAAEMQNNRSVALLQAKQPQAALDAAQGTDLIFAKAGYLRSQAIALGNQAAAMEALNRLQEAEDLYIKSSQLLKMTQENELRVYLLKTLSALQMRRGKRVEALFSMSTALDLQENLTLRERILKLLLKVPFRMLH